MPEKKNSAARIQANNKYNAKAYDRINIAIPKGRKTTIEEAAVVAGEKGLIEKGTINGLLNLLLREHLGLTESEWKLPGDAAPEAVPVEVSDVPHEEPAEAVDRAQVEAVQPVEEAAAMDRAEAVQPFELFELHVPFGRKMMLRIEAMRNHKQVSWLVQYAVECYLPDDGYLPHDWNQSHYKEACAAVEAARAEDAAKSSGESGEVITVYFVTGSLEIIEELAKKRGCSVNHIINLALAKYMEMPFDVWTYKVKPQPKKREKPWEENES